MHPSYTTFFAIGELQARFAQEDIWVRGAVVYDDLHLDRKFEENQPPRIIGPAFARAYTLEKEVARFPRVVVDGKLIASCADSTSSFIKMINDLDDRKPLHSERTLRLNSPNRVPRDVPTFVDFLQILPCEYSQFDKMVGHLEKRLVGTFLTTKNIVGLQTIFTKRCGEIFDLPT